METEGGSGSGAERTGRRTKSGRRSGMASAAALLRFLGDDIFVLIAAELDAHMLGRLGCVAQR